MLSVLLRFHKRSSFSSLMEVMMIKFTSIAALALLALANTAQAATINLDVSLGSTYSYSTGGTYTPNIKLTNPAPATLTLTGDAHVIPGFISVPNIVAAPTPPLFQGRYLAVINNPGPSGTATFDLATGDNEFALKWGTIDSYNTLVIKDSAGNTFNVTGAEILSHLSGTVIPGTTQANVSIVDPLGSILSAELETTQNSFEAANFYEGRDPTSAPLPPAVLLFGSALLGLVFFARRRGSAKL
jgi:hypothetical protein